MINIRDTRLYYESSGEGEPTLFIMHGAGAGAWIWEEQMRRLTSEFRCVAYDRRGHSRSEPGTGDQSLVTHVEDAAALIDELGLDRPVLVGNSAGGNIAIELLRRDPGIARGAIVSEPGLFSLQPALEEESRTLIGPIIKRAMDEGGPRRAFETFLETVGPDLWAIIDDQTRDRFRENAPVFLASLGASRTNVTIDVLARIGVPTPVISGSKSPEILRKIARMTAEHLPNARTVEIEDSGYVMQVEKPEQFAREVTKFVRELNREESHQNARASG